jgi:hypothetical protein
VLKIPVRADDNADFGFVTDAKISYEIISGLSGKKKYYFRIRTYKTVNGKKYYSAWFKTKAVKTK